MKNKWDMKNSKMDLEQKGYTVIPGFIDDDFIGQLCQSISSSYKLCRDIQENNGIDAVTNGTLHHLLATGDTVYLDLMEKVCESSLFTFIRDYFSGNFIINSYGGVINLPDNPSYVSNVHRDIRFFSGDFPLMLNMLIMLDDFTLENGATYVLAGSHKNPGKPVDADFYAESDRVIGKSGDILFFNSNLWHAAGINKTQEPRRAITISFTKPFMKQQLDYPRSVGYEKVETLSPKLQQIIGFFSRTPSTLYEWYQKPEKRFYRPGQD